MTELQSDLVVVRQKEVRFQYSTNEGGEITIYFEKGADLHRYTYGSDRDSWPLEWCTAFDAAIRSRFPGVAYKVELHKLAPTPTT